MRANLDKSVPQIRHLNGLFIQIQTSSNAVRLFDKQISQFLLTFECDNNCLYSKLNLFFDYLLTYNQFSL